MLPLLQLIEVYIVSDFWNFEIMKYEFKKNTIAASTVKFTFEHEMDSIKTSIPPCRCPSRGKTSE
jgi:hypothetical protein